MGMLQEFKEFAMRGNVVDMAVGIVIGGAFGKIVSSFVADVLMPPIGKVTGGNTFADLAYSLGTNADGEPILLKWGNFVQTVIDFLIIAFAIFMMIKLMNSLKRKEEEKEAPKPSNQEVLLTEIRDALKAR